MIYLASPYSAHTPDGGRNTAEEHRRYLAACTAVGLIMKTGALVYSPIVHWHIVDQMFTGEIGYEDYLAADCEMIIKCDELRVLMIAGWEKSVGVKVEIEYAKKHNKPVSYVLIDDTGIVMAENKEPAHEH